MTWFVVAAVVPMVVVLAPAQAVTPPSTEPERDQGAAADVPAAVRESMQRHREELKESGVRDLGWQLSDPTMVGDGAQWKLSNGTVYWLSGLGSKAVWSRHLKKYVAFG
ncbi:MAG: hypothetical protein GEU96_22850, partial [Propionibacteriales bacterium]|nr:hypothetical protein [Propionibacteriales bacterium]